MATEGQKAARRAVVFDTDVLVWFFRGSDRAFHFLSRVAHAHRTVSSLTLMELIQGCQSRSEMRHAKGFVLDNIPHLVHPDDAISHRALDLLERHAAAHGLRVVDALIAATVLEIGAVLATGNVRHYRSVAGLELLPFRP
jgi:predicted nucleic acid-binding protein